MAHYFKTLSHWLDRESYPSLPHYVIVWHLINWASQAAAIKLNALVYYMYKLNKNYAWKKFFGVQQISHSEKTV